MRDQVCTRRKNPWTVKTSRSIYDNPWIAVREHEVVTPGGGDGIYGVVGFKNVALGVLPLFANGDTVLVGQWRFALDCYSWELPEGGGRLGGDPVEEARRELSEETGLQAGAWREILRMDLSNSVSDEQAIGYLAMDLTQGAPHPDEDESLEIRRLPFKTALRMAIQGEITDAITVAMLLRAHHMAVEGDIEPALARAMILGGGETP